MDELPSAPLAPDHAAALRTAARDTVRGWLAAPDPAAALPAIATLGSGAIAAAADASRRLLAAAPAPVDAAAALDALRALAGEEPARGWRPFRRPAPPVDVAAALPPVIRALEDARDGLIRHDVRLSAERDRFAAADARLEETEHLLRALLAGAKAAAREIAATDPARAAALRGPVADALQARLGDVLTQLAVTRQGRLSLGLVQDGNATLAAAVEQARSITVAALRTAAAAGRAVADGERLSAQAAALGQAAVASDAADPGRDAAVRRALADAVAEVEAAIRGLRR